MDARSFAAGLWPIAAVVFIAFFIIGMAMPVLPLHLHDRLGMGTLVVGIVAGSQFGAALVSRFVAGHHADRHGPKRAVSRGLMAAVAAGVLYEISLRVIDTPWLSLGLLLCGRGLIGVAESFVITGALSWGLALGGVQNTGKVIGWLGMPMYAAFALGAPAGSAVYAAYGFEAIAWITMLAPLAGGWLVTLRPGTTPAARPRPALLGILHVVGMPGVGLALGCVGFGSITIFISLLFAQRGWSGAWGAFSALSVAFLLTRALAGHLPDRLGGARMALFSVLVEAIGQAFIWLAPSSSWVFLGAALTGVGYSFVYPGFGIEAVRRAPPESRGLVMGAYTASLDLALGLAGPGLGLVAAHAGLAAVYGTSTVLVFSAAGVALRLLPARPSPGG